MAKEAFHEFFRFQTKNNKIIKEMNKNRTSLSNLYTDSVKKLEMKKEKLFLEKNTTKWELAHN